MITKRDLTNFQNLIAHPLESDGKRTTHDWRNEPEMMEDIRMETAKFTCQGGRKCEFYQIMGQCGVMRVYVPTFCVKRTPI